MNKQESLNKTEGSLLSASLMSLLSIIIFAIGVSLITGIILMGFTKIIGLDTSVTFQQLLENDASIPDYFSNVMSYSICRIILAGLSIPVVFFLAIRDRFKGSYMNLVDLKKYKIILCVYVVIYSLLFGAYYYNFYQNAVKQYVKNNAIIQEYKVDESGYFNEGIKEIEKLPTVELIVIAASSVVAIYVTISTAESTNRKYLNKLLNNNTIAYEQPVDDMYYMPDNQMVDNQMSDNQMPVMPDNQVQEVSQEDNNIFY
jgi:hypothetical protein